MQIILLDNFGNLGKLGQKVTVKAGYARNYLVPQGKAVLATRKNVEYFEKCRMELEEKLANIKLLAEARANKIKKLGSITIQSKAGEEGKLFGSIGIRDIASAITIAGINTKKSEVRLPNGVLRTTGNHTVNIRVHSDISVAINVLIIATK